MKGRISFKPIEPGLRGLLPYNYLPGALANIAEADVGEGRRLFLLRDASDTSPARQVAPAYSVDSATLANPMALALMLKAIRSDLGDEGPADRWFLGPAAKAADQTEVAFLPHTTNLVAGARSVAAIVDGGIAFWDAAFRSGGASRFREVAYLDFDAPGGGNTPSQRLDQAGIAELCRLADTEGPRAVVRRLADRFPQSFFASERLSYSDRGWHGTGVADLMVGGIGADQDDVAVFGFELPMSVLNDHDGDSLLAVLTLTVEMVLAATKPLDHLHLVIVLPFAFVSGPQDGSHPAIAALGQLLAESGRKVDLVLPVGNHLQDRCVAHFDAPTKTTPKPVRSVIWRVPPDDFSPNSIELVRSGGKGRIDLHITPPGEDPVGISLDEGDIGFLMRGDRPIGALVRRPDTATSARVRLSLIGTGWERAGACPAPAGDWRIAELGNQAVELYALRDDRDLAADKARPRRAADFVDPRYRETDAFGAPLLQDTEAGVVRRAGTASLLASVPGGMAVQADERLGSGPRRQAWYSGNRADGLPWDWAALVDDGWPLSGQDCAANGTSERVRLSGTSAAAGLHARWLLGLSLRPPG